MKKLRNRREKGITLIALVVTIVVLIILATISINAVVGQGGIIEKTRNAAEVHKIEATREKLEIAKGTAVLTGEGKIEVDNYFKILEKENLIQSKDTDVINNEDGTYEVITVEGYVFILTVLPSSENTTDIKIEYSGTSKELRIAKTETNWTTTSVKIKVAARNANGAKYKYSYKKSSEDEGSWIDAKIGEDNTCSIEGLTENGIYDIRVMVITETESVTQVVQVNLGELPQVTKPEKWASTVTAISDGKGGVVPLPDKFYYVGGNLDTGIVISDKQGDTLDSSGINMGNQFVWIPVSNGEDFKNTLFDPNTGKPTTGAEESGFVEPYTQGYDGEKEEYNTMKTQVMKYGGFYIGRYEAGVNNTKLRTETTPVQSAVCKAGVAPYNFLPWGKSMSDIDSEFVATGISEKSTKGAVYVAKNMYSTSDSVSSTVVYGCQWDAMCVYIGNFTRKESEKSSLGLTGSTSSDVVKNIYDLAGNCSEWTMEARYKWSYYAWR